MWDTLAKHSSRTLLWEGHSCRTTSPKRALCARLLPSSAKIHTSSQFCKTSTWFETSPKIHLLSCQNERFAQDFLKNSPSKSAKRAFHARLPPSVTLQVSKNERFVRDVTRQVSKTSISHETFQNSLVKSPRLPPKVTRRAYKTSVSYKTSSKNRASSLQNKHFVKDFLQNPQVKVSKTSTFYETSSKSRVGAHASSSPDKQFPHSSPLTRQSQCHSDIHLHHNSHPHDSLRLPRNFPCPHV